MNQDIKKSLGMLVASLNEKRDVLEAVIAILAENKKAVEKIAGGMEQTAQDLIAQAIQTLDNQTQSNIQAVLEVLKGEYEGYLASLQQNSAITRGEIEKAIKAQNDRAFKRLQGLIDNIQMPQDGLPGRDGLNANPADVVPLVMELIKFPEQVIETAESVRDKLESLEGQERLDASAIKGLPDYFKKAKKAGKDLLVGGIRFLENLVDVSILPTKKRQDLLIQYNDTNKRWENGVALTVSTTQPTNPQENDLWVDLN